MSGSELDEITQLLVAASEGEVDAMDDVFASVYPRLKQLARSQRRGWRGDDTLCWQILAELESNR